jgi:hypothetical protein
VFILKGLKVPCFHTLLQVLIANELDNRLGPAYQLFVELRLAARSTQRPVAGKFSLHEKSGEASEKQKRERALAVKAQILTRRMIAER